jgi:hypothetical protein
MNWKTLIEIIIFLISVAGVFIVGYFLRFILEKVFHIHLE